MSGPAGGGYAPLRVHGHHSLLTGVDAPARLLDRARALGLATLALTDVDSLGGIVELLAAAAALSEDGGPPVPRPVVGAELSFPDGRPGRLVALVESEAGWRNLCRLVSARRLGVDPGDPATPGAAGAHPTLFDPVAAALRWQEGLVFLVDHPRLLLALEGRLAPDRLFAALAAPDDALHEALRRGPDAPGAWSALAHTDPPDPEEAALLAADKTASPSRPSAALLAALVETARTSGVPLVAAPDTWYATPAGREAHRVRAAIKRNALLEGLPASWLAREPAHLLAPAEAAALYADFPGALAAGRALAERCRYTPPLGGVVFPTLEFGEGEADDARRTPYSELARLAFEGAARRYRPLRPEVVERLHHELTSIDALGYAAYFLLVHKIAGFARERRIPCVGRGSAADSLVAYCLRLTDADPLRYRLPFERFLNPSRTDRPDIDLDFCWRRRDEVLDEVYRAFGPERTAMIATVGTFGLRSAFREAALAVGLPPAEFDRWSRRLPWSPPPREAWLRPPTSRAHLGQNPVAQAIASLPECARFPFDDRRYDAALRAAGALYDAPRHLGLHPGGVVVAPHAITDHVPCTRAAKGPVMTQLDKDDVEALGLVKMDLLGNRALTVIDDCLALLRDEVGVEPDLEALPEDDALTGDLLATGRTIGCFQIESPGMRHLLQQTAARTMDDVIQAVALIRPGPASSGMKDAYVRRFRGLEEPTPPHPRLAALLAETHGVMLYQEDVMQVAVELAGMTLAEADRLRRALKKRVGEELEALRARFHAGAGARGVERADSERVWELIANFASFGFCKAHAVTYGRIAYRCAYLKAHFPTPFLAAFLASHTGYYAPRVYVEEARRLGAGILGPDVNRSAADFTFARAPSTRMCDTEPGSVSHEGPGPAPRPGWPAIRAGLGQVRGLSEGAIERVLAARAVDGPFLSLPDLLERARPRRDEAEALIRCGALDAFDRTRPELLWRLALLAGDGPRRVPRRGRGAPGGPGATGGEDAPLDPRRLEGCVATPSTRPAEAAPNGGWGGTAGRLQGPQGALAFPVPTLPGAALPALPDPDPTARALDELELLGFTTRLHPTRLFAAAAADAALPCAELAAWAGHRITVLGWLAASRRLRGADGRWMRFLTLEDESGLAEAVLFATVHGAQGQRVDGPGPYRVTGRVEDQLGACTLHVERIETVRPPT